MEGQDQDLPRRGTGLRSIGLIADGWLLAAIGEWIAKHRGRLRFLELRCSRKLALGNAKKSFSSGGSTDDAAADWNCAKGLAIGLAAYDQ